MKISNSRLTKFIAYLLIITIVLSLITVIFIDKFYLDTLGILLSVVLILQLFRLKCIVFENTGNCITFRKHHPLSPKKFIPPFVELPQSSIQDFDINKGLGMTKLTIKIKSNRRNKAIKMLLLGFSNSQNQKIESSLQTIRYKNTNQL